MSAGCVAGGPLVCGLLEPQRVLAAAEAAVGEEVVVAGHGSRGGLPDGTPPEASYRTAASARGSGSDACRLWRDVVRAERRQRLHAPALQECGEVRLVLPPFEEPFDAALLLRVLGGGEVAADAGGAEPEEVRRQRVALVVAADGVAAAPEPEGGDVAPGEIAGADGLRGDAAEGGEVAERRRGGPAAPADGAEEVDVPLVVGVAVVRPLPRPLRDAAEAAGVEAEGEGALAEEGEVGAVGVVADELGPAAAEAVEERLEHGGLAVARGSIARGSTARGPVLPLARERA